MENEKDGGLGNPIPASEFESLGSLESSYHLTDSIDLSLRMAQARDILTRVIETTSRLPDFTEGLPSDLCFIGGRRHRMFLIPDVGVESVLGCLKLALELHGALEAIHSIVDMPDSEIDAMEVGL